MDCCARGLKNPRNRADKVRFASAMPHDGAGRAAQSRARQLLALQNQANTRRGSASARAGRGSGMRGGKTYTGGGGTEAGEGAGGLHRDWGWAGRRNAFKKVKYSCHRRRAGALACESPVEPSSARDRPSFPAGSGTVRQAFDYCESEIALKMRETCALPFLLPHWAASEGPLSPRPPLFLLFSLF